MWQAPNRMDEDTKFDSSIFSKRVFTCCMRSFLSGNSVSSSPLLPLVRPPCDWPKSSLPPKGAWHLMAWLLRVLLVCTAATLGGASAHPIGDIMPSATDGSPINFIKEARLSHPRLDDICSERFTGLEGTNIKGFQLQKVFVALTPGIRTPSNKFNHILPKPDFKSDCNFKIYADEHSSHKVRSYAESVKLKKNFKSSDKTFFKTHKSFSTSSHCDGNQLSPLGLSQLIHFGEYMKKSYQDLVVSKKNEAQKGLAETVGDEILMQTLSAVLHGALSEKEFVKSDIRKLPANFCHCRKGQLCKCDSHTELQKIIQPAFHSESHIIKGIPMHQEEKRELGNNQNTPVKELINHVASNACAKNMNTFFPKLNERNIDQMFAISDSFNSYFTNTQIFKEYAKQKVLPFINSAKSWLNLASEGSHQAKLVAIDDLMMLSLLSSLGLHLDRHLNPVSRISIEIYEIKGSELLPYSENIDLKENNVKIFNTKLKNLISQVENNNNIVAENVRHLESQRKGQRFLRILFNGDVITHHVLSCKDSNLLSLGLCSTNDFLEAFSLL